jgi:hypothetical protein
MLLPPPSEDLTFRVFDVDEDLAFEEFDRFAWLAREQAESPFLVWFRTDKDILVLCRLATKDIQDSL